MVYPLVRRSKLAPPNVQKTLRHTVSLNGKGLHSAKPANLRLLAAPVDHGIVFCRTDVDDGRDPRVPALYNNVSDTTLNTRISNADGVSVSTIEHLMAALSGCGVHNALIEIDGPEVPIFDGSSRDFAQALLNAGVVEQDMRLKVIKILKPVSVNFNGAIASLLPSDGFAIDVEINFEQAAIGRQSCALDMANGTFLRELSDCRTFCSQDDVDKMRANGLALGGSYHNAIVVQGERILSPNGLRRPDECVRHKMLDALGDLHLAGLPIWGTYQGYKSGHGLTNRLLRKLLSTPDAFEIVSADEDMTARLPGMSVDHSDLAAVV